MMQTENTSGLEPTGRAVLLRMLEREKRKGTIVLPDSVKANQAIMEQQGQVLAIGPACWDDEKAPRCSVGDKVIVTKFAGYIIRGTADDQLYRLVNDRDIFCLVKKEKETNDE